MCAAYIDPRQPPSAQPLSHLGAESTTDPPTVVSQTFRFPRPFQRRLPSPPPLSSPPSLATPSSSPPQLLRVAVLVALPMQFQQGDLFVDGNPPMVEMGVADVEVVVTDKDR